MVAKLGRPTENPRTVQMRIRMSNEEREMLDFCSEKLGKTKTDVLIMGLKKVYEEEKK